MPPTGLDPAALTTGRCGRAHTLALDRAGTALHVPPTPEAVPALDVLTRAALREYQLADPDGATGEWMVRFSGHLLHVADQVAHSPLPALVRPLWGAAHG
ncbi:hypothetical protein [Nocardiopsis composta]|uniref:Uncharacterized protein n=1 Tax=Nocardiopsis composta TaxID=157465 RepID=A0A7W8QRL3_9ACTN|nr:hypothetical protein [Nocardiopsis composta]MBB5435166.1 hypothetical protein [Nocardiopsis composta]